MNYEACLCECLKRLKQAEESPTTPPVVNTNFGYGSIQDFRDIFDLSAPVFIVTEAGKQGFLIYDPDDTSSQDDGLNILVRKGKRYKRITAFNGEDGSSAYQIAVDNGFEGDESEWLLSLVGQQGAPGEASAEFIALVDGVTQKHSDIEAIDQAISLTAIQIETKRQEVAGNTQVVLEAKEDIVAALNSDVTVDTYAQAAALFTGVVKRTIFVNQASEYNDPGEYFVWFPVVQKAAHMGLDFNFI